MNTGHSCVTLPDIYDIGLLSNNVEEAFDLTVFEKPLFPVRKYLLQIPQFSSVVPERDEKFLAIVFDTECISFFGNKVGMI